MNIYVTIALSVQVIKNNYYATDFRAQNEEVRIRNESLRTAYQNYLTSLRGKYKDFPINNIDSDEQLRNSLDNCLTAQRQDLNDFLDGKKSLTDLIILPPEFTSVYNILKTCEADQAFMSKLGQDTLNVKLFLLSTDTCVCAASNYILEKLLDEVTVKAGKLTALFKIEHDANNSAFVLNDVLPDQKTFNNDGLQYLFNTLDSIDKKISACETKNPPRINPIDTVSRKFMVIQGVSQFIPYFTIYALLNNITAITAPSKMNNLAMKPLPISFEIDKIDSYKFILDSMNSNILQADDAIAKEMGYYGLIYQDNDSVYHRTPFGNILKNMEYESTAIGHIYEDHTVCSLLSGPNTIKDKILSGIKLYRLGAGKENAVFTTEPPNPQQDIYTDIDILIIKDYDKSITTRSYKAVFCECKSFGQIIRTHFDADGSEVLDLMDDSRKSIRTQIKKAAELFSFINRPSNKRLQTADPLLSLIKYAVEYRVYIYALNRKSINDRLDDIAKKLYDIWLENYTVTTPGFNVGFMVYHAILKDNLKDFVVNDVEFRQALSSH